ncbi:AP-5 complex subunit beta-1 [Cololabis saira]|uniref:AP-5 complex subunit beta-1 n=1 Tax=Cololabis saira TaxID=129043 RepID=UPI002AD2DF94|nr:AP-5 complex subunit beta-1 [Cololabis saira]
MAAGWSARISAFLRGPRRFLSGTSADSFLAELLRELRDDRAASGLKVLLLSPLCEHPALLCPSASSAEDTALELSAVFAQCPPTAVEFRCQLLVAVTCVLVCSPCTSGHLAASRDFLELLLQVAQDPQGGGLRATACECLREMERCCPGLLSQRLELLDGLRQQESSRLHQAYAGLHALVLRNAVHELTQQAGAGPEHLRALLGGNAPLAWEAEQDSGPTNGSGSAGLSSLLLGPMGAVPTLHTGPDCKELRAVLSSLLEESYLLTPLCQAALLHRLIEVVAMVPGIPPAIFRAQLLRLLGTSEVCLLHTTLLLKSAFTDSLFSAEDEAFMLKRLVVLSQHPLLSTPEKLFYMDCIAHFPENRPIGCGDGDEALPLLLTQQLASALLPTVFNDGATLLARLHLLCLVHLEEDGGEEDGAGGDGAGGDVGRGLAYLYDHLTSLLHIVESGGSREIVVTFFRASFLFLSHFHGVERYAAGLVERLCRLYLRQPQLAPQLINLADQTQARLPGCDWALGLLKALQQAVISAPLGRLTLRDLGWHLKTLARVAEEGEIPQHGTLGFLSGIVAPAASSLCGGGDWRLGNGVLGVCRRLLVHPSLNTLLLPLADVLQHLSCNYRDIDVQDRARLYYSLLTTLSQEKLVAVMEQPVSGGVSGQQVKKRTLSCLMAESEGLASALTVHQTGKTILRLREAGSTAPDAPPALDVTQAEAEECSDEAGGALDAYRAQFSEPGFASQITLRFQLTHVDADDPRFDQLFSIRLHFSLTDESYRDLQDVSVPCVFRERAAPVVELRLTPRLPYPTTLRVQAIFTTRDGLTWTSSLPDVHVAFQQTFQALPAPVSWGPASRLSVFQQLWEELSGEAGDCALSLFCCQLTDAALRALVGKHFPAFLVPDPSCEDEVKVLLFLPPQSHVLLRIRADEDAVHFSIATNDWRLLPHVNSYLLAVTSAPDHAPPTAAAV